MYVCSTESRGYLLVGVAVCSPVGMSVDGLALDADAWSLLIRVSIERDEEEQVAREQRTANDGRSF